MCLIVLLTPVIKSGRIPPPNALRIVKSHLKGLGGRIENPLQCIFLPQRGELKSQILQFSIFVLANSALWRKIARVYLCMHEFYYK